MKKKIAIGLIAMSILGASAAPKNAIIKDLTVKRDATFNGGINVPNATEGQVLVSDADGNLTPQTLLNEAVEDKFPTVDGGIGHTGAVFILGTLTAESFRVSFNETPTGETACQDGTIKRDANYIYVCSGSTYKRASLSSF